jgi:hypothetical protein
LRGLLRPVGSYAKEWGVYAKRPFGGPAQILKYLARYTHRVAISNARLLDLCDGRVTFRCKDYADAQKHRTMTLDTGEFLRRFVQLVLPKSFVKIRHYGLLANAQREARLAACRRLLLVTAVPPAPPREHATCSHRFPGSPSAPATLGALLAPGHHPAHVDASVDGTEAVMTQVGPYGFCSRGERRNPQSWKSNGANWYRLRRQVCHSWAVSGDS